MLISGGTLRRLVGFTFAALVLYLFFAISTHKPRPPQRPVERLRVNSAFPYYDWDTRSAFHPVSVENAANASVEELCASFPTYLLDDIQPVLKTGHDNLESKVRAHLQTVSACLTNLLIFSDRDTDFDGHDVIDVIADISPHLVQKFKPLAQYRELQSFADSNDIELVDKAYHTHRQGWKFDKFKFLPAISRAWRMRPEKRWYVFFEDDTYVVWDSVFRLLENFDPDVPLYFGSPTPGEGPSWFANGGPGYIISREAMRRLTEEDWSKETGEYIGSKVTERHWDMLVGNCCGDSMVGWALYTKNVSLSGMWPSFNPHSPHGVPFSDNYWCQPILTMHKPLVDHLPTLWSWEGETRSKHRPLLYRDLALSYHHITDLTQLDNWNNAEWDEFGAPAKAHSSLESCRSGCEAHGECFQYTYHLRKCKFVRSIRIGRQQMPEVGADASDGDKVTKWEAEDLKYVSGWMQEKIKRWVAERPCEEVLWVTPSTDRIY